MDKLPHAAARFTPQVMAEYIKLYDAFIGAKDSSIEFVNGPQFDANDCVVFETGTEECLSVIQSHNGVPLSTFSGTILGVLFSQLPLIGIPRYSGMHL